MRECFENLSTKNHVGQQILLFENNGVRRDCFFYRSVAQYYIYIYIYIYILFSVVDLK